MILFTKSMKCTRPSQIATQAQVRGFFSTLLILVPFGIFALTRPTFSSELRMIRTLDEACLRGARHADTLDRLTRSLSCDRSDPETDVTSLLSLSNGSEANHLIDAISHILQVVGGVIDPLLGTEATAFQFRPSEPGVSVPQLRQEFADCFAKRMFSRGADYSGLPAMRTALPGGPNSEPIQMTRLRFWRFRLTRILSQIGDRQSGRLSGTAFMDLIRAWYDHMTPRCSGSLIPFPEFDARLAALQAAQSQLEPVPSVINVSRTLPATAANECRQIQDIQGWLQDLQQNTLFWQALGLTTSATTLAATYEILAARGFFSAAAHPTGRLLPALAASRNALMRGASRGTLGGPVLIAVGVLASLLLEPNNSEAATHPEIYGYETGSMTGHYLAHPETYFSLSPRTACRYLQMDDRLGEQVRQVHSRLSEVRAAASQP